MLANEKSPLLDSNHTRVAIFIENSTQKQFDEEYKKALDTVKKRYQELVDIKSPLNDRVNYLKQYEFWHDAIIFTAQQYDKLPKDYKKESVLS